ncbi:type-F conjugative transfer system secretin TraK [Moritella viscosa]|uniref:type-F conjugative transfer system secretin TraK n=1 Tax=Moritella viscosa TaxID=80854 RepID=UPI000916AD7F|nr:type-F conjugative transfer system secretin TraK [Moritella viscosa]SGZ09603.1 Conjugative transfer protein TraK [Moritella viscosa]
MANNTLFKARVTSIVLALVFSSSVFAKNVPATIYEFDDNDTIPIKLSSLNLNRLVVEDDKITALSCPIGFCTTHGSKKDKSGSITVKLNIALPFTAHVSTTKGRNFALFVTPKAAPAVVSKFKASNSHVTKKSVFSRAFDYPVQIAKLTKEMVLWSRFKTPIDGFKVHEVDPQSLPKTKRDDLAIIPKTVFVGADYSAIIYTLKNQTQKTMPITTAQFYSFSARSASISKNSLAPNEEALLYIVTGGGVNHAR